MPERQKNAPYNEFYRTLGVNIGKLRTARNETQEALGHALGRSRSMIQQWELGAVMIKAEDLVALAKHFGVTVEALTGTSTASEWEKAAEIASNFSCLPLEAVLALRNESKDPEIGLSVFSTMLTDCYAEFHRINWYLFKSVEARRKANDYHAGRPAHIFDPSESSCETEGGKILLPFSETADYYAYQAARLLRSVIDQISKPGVELWKTAPGADTPGADAGQKAEGPLPSQDNTDGEV